MDRRTLVALLSGILLCVASPAHAQASGAVGYWVGQVSWNERMIFYSWEINADRTFTSGREGRGHDGGGAWSLHGARLTLKYGDGFRYEGELSGDGYAGTAFGANGRAFGSFSMSRSTESADGIEEQN